MSATISHKRWRDRRRVGGDGQQWAKRLRDFIDAANLGRRRAS